MSREEKRKFYKLIREFNETTNKLDDDSLTKEEKLYYENRYIALLEALHEYTKLNMKKLKRPYRSFSIKSTSTKKRDSEPIFSVFCPSCGNLHHSYTPLEWKHLVVKCRCGNRFLLKKEDILKTILQNREALSTKCRKRIEEILKLDINRSFNEVLKDLIKAQVIPREGIENNTFLEETYKRIKRKINREKEFTPTKEFNVCEKCGKLHSLKYNIVYCKQCGRLLNTYRRGWEREKEEKRSRRIPKHVQREVWRRDQGRCVECGSKERLEFDHIIPFSKGGSNTARNIQLLCEQCNRKKQNNI